MYRKRQKAACVLFMSEPKKAKSSSKERMAVSSEPTAAGVQATCGEQ